MRITAAQRIHNENRIRAAMDRLMRGEIPPGGNCDIKTLALEAGVDRTAFYAPGPTHTCAPNSSTGFSSCSRPEKPQTRESLRSNASKRRSTSLKPILPRRIRQSMISLTSEAEPWPGSPPSTTRSFNSVPPTTQLQLSPASRIARNPSRK
jgi:hypothetical protein